MAFEFNTEYPSIHELREKTKKRIPRFAFEYLDNGCNDNINLERNTVEIREIQLRPQYLKNYEDSNLETEIFGLRYSMPLGISPIGLQGLVWPNATEILAKAAHQHNIPFILSTVATSSIERVGELTEGSAWFQLYNPTEEWLRKDLIQRVATAKFPVLVLLCDVPTFGYRPKEIRNGLAMPPRMNWRNIIQILGKPDWALETLRVGVPQFANLTKYMDQGLSLNQLGEFMNQTFSGRLNAERIKPIRDMWKGKLVLKGVISEEDTEEAIRLGFDGIIVSNHGGRQLDPGESTIKPVGHIARKYGHQITVMMDSGLRSGPDVASCMANGAKFTFMGRSFMYGVGALGKDGGNHTIAMIKRQLSQIMQQLCCESIEDLPKHLVQNQKR